MKKWIKAPIIVMVLAGIGIMLSSCRRETTVFVSEFYVDKQFCKEHLLPEKLYRINTQGEMDALFPDQSLYSLNDIDFTKHTVFLVYGVVPGNFTQNVTWEKTQTNEYLLQVMISVGSAAVANSTWAVACITNVKLSDKDKVILDLNLSNPYNGDE